MVPVKGAEMPQALATLRRLQCRALSKRSGQRCKRWCAPGHLTCKLHGGGSPQAARSAQVRATVAEVMAANPRRSVREIVADSLHIADLVMTDEIAKLGEGMTPELAESVMQAAGRASALARAAADMGIDVDSGEALAEQHGARIAEALRVVVAELVSAAGGTGTDHLAAREWVGRAVPAALRGQEVPGAPRPWRMTHLLAIESGDRFRRREAEAVSAALSGPRTAAGPSLVSGVQRDTGRLCAAGKLASGGWFWPGGVVPGAGGSGSAADRAPVVGAVESVEAVMDVAERVARAFWTAQARRLRREMKSGSRRSQCGAGPDPKRDHDALVASAQARALRRDVDRQGAEVVITVGNVDVYTTRAELAEWAGRQLRRELVAALRVEVKAEAIAEAKAAEVEAACREVELRAIYNDMKRPELAEARERAAAQRARAQDETVIALVASGAGPQVEQRWRYAAERGSQRAAELLMEVIRRRGQRINQAIIATAGPTSRWATRRTPEGHWRAQRDTFLGNGDVVTEVRWRWRGEGPWLASAEFDDRQRRARERERKLRRQIPAVGRPRR